MLEDSHDIICVSCALSTELDGNLHFIKLCVYICTYLCVHAGRAHASQVESTPLILFNYLLLMLSLCTSPTPWSLSEHLLKLLKPLPQPRLLQCVAKMVAHYQWTNTDGPLDAGRTSLFQELLAVASLLLCWRAEDEGVETSTLLSLYSSVEGTLTALIPSVSVPTYALHVSHTHAPPLSHCVCT